MFALSVLVLYSVRDKNTGMAANGFATEMIEVKTATNKVPGPFR